LNRIELLIDQTCLITDVTLLLEMNITQKEAENKLMED